MTVALAEGLFDVALAGGFVRQGAVACEGPYSMYLPEGALADAIESRTQSDCENMYLQQV